MLHFFREAFSTPMGAAVVLLTLGVLFVNGWTDAPNAIAAGISTGAMTLRQGVLLATVMNLLGGLSTLVLGRQVAETVFSLGSFAPGAAGRVALAAAMTAVILWAVLAWYGGIPTSESHGLMAGLMGAALAQGAGGISLPALCKVLIGLLVSIGLGLLGGWLLARLLAPVQMRPAVWRRGQIASAAAMAFAHGLQDTPKFASVLLLGMSVSEGGGFSLPLWAPLLCAVVMGLGTLLGGGRIIRTVGEKMVKIDRKEGFAADLAGTGALLLSTMQGLPVSTTHAKTTALMGAALSKPGGFVNRRIAARMFLSWLATFPLCGLISYLLTRLLLLLVK